jgi:hypothetical protein
MYDASDLKRLPKADRRLIADGMRRLLAVLDKHDAAVCAAGDSFRVAASWSWCFAVKMILKAVTQN